MSDTMTSARSVQITPPAKLTGLKLTPLPGKAAGMGAVTVSMQHIAHEIGLWKGLQVLAKLNQRDGFDCPGCAWPEPAHPSKCGEYFQNDPNALADEATPVRWHPAFCAKHAEENMKTGE